MDWALAVDYGTIITCAAVGSGDRVEILEIDFDRCLPSPVGLGDDGRFVTGRDAVALARWDAGRVEPTPKRALVAGAAVRLGDGAVDPIDLVAATLRRVADEALRRFGGRPPSRVVLTHPVRCTPVETDRLLAAATRAGLASLELLPEPSAVAAFHGAAVPVGGHVAVYGLGSDSFSAAVLRRTATSFELRGAGHRDVGGEAVDDALLDLVAGHARGTGPDAWDAVWNGPSARGHAMRERLLEAKAELSSRPWVAIEIDGIESGVRITRRELERAVEERLAATVDELLRTVRDAGVEPTALEAVYLTGGASRMPRISELIRERTGLTAEIHDDPKAAVALGALERLPARAAPELVGVAAGWSAGPASVTPAFADPARLDPAPRDPAPLDSGPLDPAPLDTLSPGVASGAATSLAAGAQDQAPGAGAPVTDREPEPAAVPATRPTHRLRPVLVGMGMAALVAGVVTPIAFNARATSTLPATVPLVVAATAPRPAPTSAARPGAGQVGAAQGGSAQGGAAQGGAAQGGSAQAGAAPAAPTSVRSAPPRSEEPDLDARHLALLRDLSDAGGVRWASCRAYPAAETAIYATAIQCSPRDPSLARNVVFYRLADGGAYTAMYQTSKKEVTGSGSCADGTASSTTWTDGAAPKGFLVCFDDPGSGNFRMAWASSDSLVAAAISDPKPSTAYTWWKAHSATLP